MLFAYGLSLLLLFVMLRCLRFMYCLFVCLSPQADDVAEALHALAAAVRQPHGGAVVAGLEELDRVLEEVADLEGEEAFRRGDVHRHVRGERAQLLAARQAAPPHNSKTENSKHG